MIVITTHGVAFLSDSRAVAQADGVPDSPGRHKVASLYPGIWTAAQAQAALTEYERWFSGRGEVGHHWYLEHEAAKARIAEYEEALRPVQVYLDLLTRALESIGLRQPLPIPDELPESPGAMYSLWISIENLPVDLLAGEIETTIDEVVENLAASAAGWLLAIENELQITTSAVTLMQAQGPRNPPYVHCVHNGEHILDIPECFTVGGDRDKEAPWRN